MSTIAEQTESIIDSLRNGRKAILGRGGAISATAGLKDFPTAIYNIPADNAITTVVDKDIIVTLPVPDNATGYAYLAEFGGMTYRIVDELRNEVMGGFGVFRYDEETGSIDYENGAFAYFSVPTEILSLEGYGEGIDINHYNKVDLVNQKYKRVIETFVFDENVAGWFLASAFGNNSTYFRLKIGDYGTYVNDAVVCDKYDAVNITSSTITVGVDVINSTAGGDTGSYIALRPDNVASMTSISDLYALLAKNPITVKVARKVPIETDLPVYVNPIFKVEPKAEIETDPNDGQGMPVKIIFQTLTQ